MIREKMKWKKKVVGSLCITMAMSLLCLGCGKVDESDEVSTEVEAVISNTQGGTSADVQGDTAQGDTGKKGDATKGDAAQVDVSKESNATNTSVVPAEDEVQPNEWEVARVSGTVEDFKAYFDLDLSPYKEQIETVGTLEEISYHSKVINADRQAFVYTPYGYDENAEYPIIYLLHGIGCDGTQWTSMGACKIFDNMIAKGEIEPFVAVFPSVVPADGLDKNTFSQKNITAFAKFPAEWEIDIAPFMYENYAVSEEREKTAICGLSMGGMEALDTGFRLLKRFAYIGSFSAAPSLEQKILTTEGSDYIPELVLLCSGDADNTVGDNPKNYHQTLTKNGVDHIWYQHPKQGHSVPVWNLGLLNFLKRIF